MAKALADFATIFNPNDTEPEFLFCDEALEWLENRCESETSHFPEIEEAFRKEDKVAREYQQDLDEDID